MPSLPTWDNVALSIDRRLTAVEANVLHVRRKVDALNDWHNRVTGALYVLGALGTATLAFAVIIFKYLLDKVG